MNPHQERWTGFASATQYKSNGGLDKVIGSLGRSDFEDKLVGFLNSVCPADHFHIFKFAPSVPSFSTSISMDGSRVADYHARTYCNAQLWGIDHPFTQAGTSIHETPALFRWPTAETDGELKHIFLSWGICDRMISFGAEACGTRGFTAIRSTSNRRFSDEDKYRFALATELAFPLMARQQSLTIEVKNQFSTSVTSVKAIEECLVLAPEALTPREVQVGARTLYGLSAEGIALDLGVGYQTVITHRKHLYERLSISGSRELWRWYLTLRGEVSHLLPSVRAASNRQSE